ncbi:hypothetical protein KFL_000600390 [Klebsormidium nitens]|uniref:Uncharacterized protein n=1 Tax=Klebsormidium nitens TaxID=105231 RepID=A0A1Y1HSD3_KLENI|nr:hypothetical protein KFL_000600390 [Klebsormidium nitens]|eukprot:GAQ80722.1 hypothetical protein KFL_000600390 [Klebsormidium nitens]
MDTPTMQRLTRSRARSQPNTAEKPFTSQAKSKKKADAPADSKERAPFCDLTNSNSPIAGIVPGKLQTQSRLKRTPAKSGPGSPQQDGEEVLRSQVRALLEKQPELAPLPLLELPSDDAPSVYSPCSATKKAPTPANTPVTSSSSEIEVALGGSVNKGLQESAGRLLAAAIEKLETEHAAEETDDEGSPPPTSHSITRALRFDADSDPDSPTALLVRTPVVPSRRLKSVVVVPSPEEGSANDAAEDADVWSPLLNSNSPASGVQQHQLQWSMEVNVSSPERYVPGGDTDGYGPDADSDAERKEGPSGPKEEAPSQVSTIPLMKLPLALGVFSPVPAPRVAWRRHAAAAGKPSLFEDLPTVVLEDAGPKKALGVPPLSPKLAAGKRVVGATLPLLRRALHNESAKKQKEKKPSPAKAAAGSAPAAPQEFPVPAWYSTGSPPPESPTKETALDSESLDVICDVMESLQVADGPVVLRGLPAHEGSHVRFDSDGEVEEEEEGKLRGLPAPKGMHTRFE